MDTLVALKASFTFYIESTAIYIAYDAGTIQSLELLQLLWSGNSKAFNDYT